MEYTPRVTRRATPRPRLRSLRTSASFRDFVLDQLSEVPALSARAMFGGLGLYSGDVFFGLVAADVLYFKVDNINVAHVTLWGRGVKFLDEPHPIIRMPEQEIWISFFRDPDGNPLALMEERRLV